MWAGLSWAAADSRGGWDERAVKEYVTIIKINNLPPDAGLKPGMTAQVTIKVKTIPNVLMVPVQSVSQHKSKHYTYVVKDRDVAKREVTIGETNDKYVVIETGLEQDELVVLDSRARLADEAKKEEGVGPVTETPAATPPPPAVPATAAAATK